MCEVVTLPRNSCVGSGKGLRGGDLMMAGSEVVQSVSGTRLWVFK